MSLFLKCCCTKQKNEANTFPNSEKTLCWEWFFMLSHCNCSSKTHESNKTCSQIVNHSRRLLQTGPNLMLRVIAAPRGAGTHPWHSFTSCTLDKDLSCHFQQRPLPNMRMGKSHHKSAAFPDQQESTVFLGGTRREFCLALGEPRGGMRLSEASVAGTEEGWWSLREQMLHFQWKVVLSLAKVQKYLQIQEGWGQAMTVSFSLHLGYWVRCPDSRLPH